MNIYIYIYNVTIHVMYIGDWGEIIDAGDPNREIGSGFGSCSCRACVRAKLCGCVREVSPNAGGSNGNKSDSGLGCTFCCF